MGVLCESLGPETFSRLQDGAGLMQHVLLTLVSGLDSLEKRLTAAQNATEEKVRQLQLSLENLSSHILAEEEEELEEERCEQSLELKEPEGSWMGGENNDIKESPTDLEGELEGDAQSVDAIGTTANENEMSHSGSTGNEEDSKHEDHEESGAVEVMPGSQNGSEQARQRWQWAYGQVRTMLRERKPMKRSSSISSTSSSTSGKRLHSRVAALEAVIENLQRELEVQAQQRELALQEAQTQQNKLESTLKDAAAKSSQVRVRERRYPIAGCKSVPYSHCCSPKDCYLTGHGRCSGCERADARSRRCYGHASETGAIKRFGHSYLSIYQLAPPNHGD
jgi:hypothetical protein